ncbi:HlyD family type I secretion periplasmic adaptor subunit [Nisaea sediminum]|uniref:HlyD family type I secretion periplasmic adaptor subunit n=1 Tax=Nisaea sediminum TaxID=2775867 RepID=UPI0018692B6D|nr:HlyD family type I secretion periplasmic adaptor subunit [Nisaea sediminum]
MAEIARIVPRRISAEELARERAAAGDASVHAPAAGAGAEGAVPEAAAAALRAAAAGGTPPGTPAIPPAAASAGGGDALGHDDLKDLHDAFLASRVEAAVAPPSRLLLTLPAIMAGMLLLAGIWAWFGHLDIVVAAPGKIVPGGKVKVVESSLPGIVRMIHVEDGAHVQAGDPLLSLDPTESGADLEKLTREWTAARLDVARHEALIGAAALAGGGAPLAPDEVFAMPEGAAEHEVAEALAVLRAEWAALTGERERAAKDAARARATLASLRAEQAKVRAVLPLLTERVAGQRILFEKQLTQKSVYLEHEQVLLETQHQALILESRIAEATATLASAEATAANLLLAFEAETQRKLNEARQRESAAGQEQIKARDRVGRLTLAAPVAGEVTGLAVHTLGGYVQPGTALMRIVPEEARLTVEATVTNRDIGFIEIGQRAAVKVDAFNYMRYGSIEGKVVSLSADAVVPQDANNAAGAPGAATSGPQAAPQMLSYTARIELEREHLRVDGRDVRLVPGMSVTADLLTGERRVLEYVLQPVLRYAREGMRER